MDVKKLHNTNTNNVLQVLLHKQNIFQCINIIVLRSLLSYTCLDIFFIANITTLVTILSF